MHGAHDETVALEGLQGLDQHLLTGAIGTPLEFAPSPRALREDQRHDHARVSSQLMASRPASCTSAAKAGHVDSSRAFTVYADASTMRVSHTPKSCPPLTTAPGQIADATYPPECADDSRNRVATDGLSTPLMLALAAVTRKLAVISGRPWPGVSSAAVESSLATNTVRRADREVAMSPWEDRLSRRI